MKIRSAPVVTSGPAIVADREQPVRIAVFGAGKAAKFHLHAIEQMVGTRVVGICSRSGTTAARLAEPLGAFATTDVDDLVDPSQIDAAIVAVSDEVAPGITARLLDAGIAVLVEKPAGPTASTVLDLADRADASGALAVVGVNRRYLSTVGAGLAAVRQRGPVRGVLVEAHEPTDLLLAEGAVAPSALAEWFRLDAVHYVDLLRYAGGEVDAVLALHGDRRTAPCDHLSASLRFGSGAVGTFVSHWNSGAPTMMRLYGDHVTAEVRLSQPGGAWLEFGPRRRVALQPDWADTIAKPGVYGQDAAFLTAVAAGRPTLPPASDLRDHAATLQLVERLLAGGDPPPVGLAPPGG